MEINSKYCFINYGCGVNSTAILAMMCLGEIKISNPIISFSDVGGEKTGTYDYLAYISEKIKEKGYVLNIVNSKEGSLLEYCRNKKILPMRRLRWCTDRWKKKPLNDYMDSIKGDSEDYSILIGIDYGEQKRARRWMNDKHIIFPLIDLKMDRSACIDKIKQVGWKVPEKSGCYFCPYAKMSEFKQLKIDYPGLFEDLCDMERLTLERLSSSKMKGWYDQNRPLKKAVEHRYPELNEDQTDLCFHCML